MNTRIETTLKNTSLAQRIAVLETAVDNLETMVGRLLPENRPDDTEFGGNLDAWVDGWLLPRLERQIAHGSGAGLYWCPRWRDHPEAATRLEAVRDAWTEARVGTAGAMASWWLEKVDPTLRTICAPDGPFTRCREQHRRLPELPSHPHLEEVPPCR
jgi:hypothetical protein